MSYDFDYLIIGAGSGGMASARRAAQYGARVGIIEKNRLGGTCVNIGCVPKKVMFNAASIAQSLDDAPGYGFRIESKGHDWPMLKKSRDAYIKRLNEIYATNLDNDKVTLFTGVASFKSPHELLVDDKIITAEHILIATGNQPIVPNIPGHELGITSDGFFLLEEMPRSCIIAGAGYIAVELAGVFQALGCQTTLLIRHEKVLRNFDKIISNGVTDALEQQGVTIKRNSTVAALKRTGNQISLTLENREQISTECFLWAVGRKPNFAELNLGAIDLHPNENGHLMVDAYQNTLVNGIYAVGDVTGQQELTPVAIAAGRALSDRLFGNIPNAKIDYENIPSVIFSHPPAGIVGLSQQQAIAKWGSENIRTYQTRFVNMYYAPLQKKKPTLMKMITLLPNEKVVGLHLIGEGCDEMLQGFAVAIKMGATRHDFNSTIAIHPTASEEVVLFK